MFESKSLEDYLKFGNYTQNRPNNQAMQSKK